MNILDVNVPNERERVVALLHQMKHRKIHTLFDTNYPEHVLESNNNGQCFTWDDTLAQMNTGGVCDDNVIQQQSPPLPIDEYMCFRNELDFSSALDEWMDHNFNEDFCTRFHPNHDDDDDDDDNGQFNRKDEYYKSTYFDEDDDLLPSGTPLCANIEHECKPSPQMEDRPYCDEIHRYFSQHGTFLLKITKTLKSCNFATFDSVHLKHVSSCYWGEIIDGCVKDTPMFDVINRQNSLDAMPHLDADFIGNRVTHGYSYCLSTELWLRSISTKEIGRFFMNTYELKWEPEGCTRHNSVCGFLLSLVCCFEHKNNIISWTMVDCGSEKIQDGLRVMRFHTITSSSSSSPNIDHRCGKEDITLDVPNIDEQLLVSLVRKKSGNTITMMSLNNPFVFSWSFCLRNVKWGPVQKRSAILSDMILRNETVNNGIIWSSSDVFGERVHLVAERQSNINNEWCNDDSPVPQAFCIVPLSCFAMELYSYDFAVVIQIILSSTRVRRTKWLSIMTNGRNKLCL